MATISRRVSGPFLPFSRLLWYARWDRKFILTNTTGRLTKWTSAREFRFFKGAGNESDVYKSPWLRPSCGRIYVLRHAPLQPRRARRDTRAMPRITQLRVDVCIRQDSRHQAIALLRDQHRSETKAHPRDRFSPPHQDHFRHRQLSLC